MKKITMIIATVMLCMFTAISAYAMTAQEAADAMQFSDISFEAEDSVTLDLAFISKYKGYDVTWSSADTDVISDSGKVTRPGVGDEPVTVSVTATIGGAVKVFTPTVLPYADAEDVLVAERYALTYAAISGNGDIAAAQGELSLPSTGKISGTVIRWTSSDNSVLRIERDGDDYKGIIVNPYFSDGTYNVLLSATIVHGDEFTEKLFYLKISEQKLQYVYTDTIADASEKFATEFILNNNLQALRKNLVFPDISGATVTYSSSDTSVIENDGTIHRAVDTDSAVNFTVTLQQGFERVHYTYSVIVKAEDKAEIANLLDEDLDWVINYVKSSQSLGSVVSDISLPTQGINGSNISWSSSNTAVVSDTGDVTRGNADAYVTLTVRVYYADEYRESTIELCVKASTQGTAAGGGGGGGGGGAGGGSGSGNENGVPLLPTEPEIPPVTEPLVFDDVPRSHWAYEAITGLYDREIVDGVAPGEFQPNAYATREAFVKMLMLTVGIPLDSYSTSFIDADTSEWYYPFVSTAAKHGIVTGYSADVFGIGDNITREDICVIIHRAAFDGKTAQSTAAFGDRIGIADYAAGAVDYLYEAGIVNGDDDGNFNPKNNATRAEIAAMLYRLINIL